MRDVDGLENLYIRRAIQFGCGGTTCHETQAAREVEHAVGDEPKAHDPGPAIDGAVIWREILTFNMREAILM